MAKTNFNLRDRIPISYFEPEEPNFDEYLYCEECTDYVYEYCAIHGHLLVIPDDKVPVRTKFPSYVPRAALTIPHVFLHLAPSIIPGAGLGVFSTLTLPRGVRFGPYCGKRTPEINSMYCWQIYSGKNKPSHVLDAADGNRSNWMRYVNCARHWREQNLIAYQYQGQLYYRTIKIIPRYTELLVFYGSEFAKVLNINLSKYNCDKYYRDLQLSGTPFAAQQDRENTNKLSKTLNIPDIVEPIYDSIKNYEDKENQTVKNTEKPTLNKENTEFDQYKVNFKDDTNIDTQIQNTFSCKICNKTFNKKRNLNRHIKLHYKNLNEYPTSNNDNTDFDPHQVNFKDEFNTDSQLIQNTVFSCEICNKTFNKKSNLNRHIKLHYKNLNEYLNKEKIQYSCQKCSYTTQIDNYLINFCKHEDKIKKPRSKYAKPKKCDVCDFETLSKRAFSLHSSKHKGEVYKCDHCNYSNYLKYNLSRHIFKKHNNAFFFNRK